MQLHFIFFFLVILKHFIFFSHNFGFKMVIKNLDELFKRHIKLFPNNASHYYNSQECFSIIQKQPKYKGKLKLRPCFRHPLLPLLPTSASASFVVASASLTEDQNIGNLCLSYRKYIKSSLLFWSELIEVKKERDTKKKNVGKKVTYVEKEKIINKNYEIEIKEKLSVIYDNCFRITSSLS